MIFDKLFQLMAEKQASDIFVSAGAPIHIKIQGTTIPINQQVMDPATIQKMAYEMMTPEQIKRFEATEEMNLSFGVREVGNFRVNMFWQRGSIAIVVRFIPGRDSAPRRRWRCRRCCPKSSWRSAAWCWWSVPPVPASRPPSPSMLDHRNSNRTGHILTIEDPIEFLFKHKKSIVNQREIGMDTLSWGDALKNAMRQAPDCILIGEIRDKETMQAAHRLRPDRPPVPGDAARQQRLPRAEPHHQLLPAGKPHARCSSTCR